MATISRSHKINQASESIFRNLLPLSHFVVRPQNPDYHVDYFVELIENNEPSGIYFGVQLKGTEKLLYKGGNIKFSLKSKHLKYYLDNVKKFPVYLIVIDVTSKNAYWLFLQKYLNDEILNKHWRNQDKVQIYINNENVINKLDDFKKTVVEANHYITELWPSSVLSSAKKEKEYFESLDPRFKVESISAIDKNIKYRFHSNESLNIEFQIKNGKRFQEQLNDPNVEKIVVKKEDINVSGSDLLTELLKRSSNVEFDVKFPTGNVKIFLYKEHKGKTISEMIILDGKLSFHGSFFKLDCSQLELPLRIQVIINLKEKEKPKFDFTFNFNSWINKQVRYLPYFDQLDSTFTNINEGDKLIFIVEEYGYKLMWSQIDILKYSDFMKSTTSYFSIVKKLKTVDLHYNLNLKFSGFEKLNMEEVYDIEMLFDLLTFKEHTVKNRSLTINVSIINDKKLYERFKNGGDLRLISDYNFTILGKTFLVERITLDISMPKFMISDSEFLELLNSDKEFIPLKFTTDENSKIIYKKLDKAN